MSLVSQRPSPAALIASTRAILARLTPAPSSSILPFIPKPVKYLLLLLLLLNSPSWPFVWHIRVWWYAVKAYYLVYKKGRSKYLNDWVKRNRWDGGIQGVKTRVKRIADISDCDYNLHLSNSCYAKNSDPARMDYCIATMSPLFTPGAHMALGASHYQFIKEIPIGSEYVMETRTGGWGEKWFYVVTEFIIYPNKGKSSARSNGVTHLPSAGNAKAEVQSLENKLLSSVKAPGGPAPSTMEGSTSSSADTPTAASSGASTPAVNGTTSDGVKQAANARAREPRKDGGIVCAVGVFEYCFKMGRVTIPPRVALYHAMQSPSDKGRDHAKKLVMSRDGGKAWLRGKWRDEPDAESLGRDIGLPIASSSTEDAKGSWIEKARKGMEQVNEGLAVF